MTEDQEPRRRQRDGAEVVRTEEVSTTAEPACGESSRAAGGEFGRAEGPAASQSGSASTGSGCRVRPVEPSDGPGIHSLLTAMLPDVLADRERWLARWHWQYWDNPHRGGRAVGWVLADGDGIRGHLGTVYLPLRAGDARVTAAVGADYAVSNERDGVFAALDLAQALFASCEDCLVMTTTANEHTGAVFGRFGCRPVEWTREFWRCPPTVSRQVRACLGGTSRVCRRLMGGRVGPLIAGAAAATVNYLPSIPISRGHRLETTVPQLARDLGQLWERVSAAELTDDQDGRWQPRLCLGVDRSQSYLDWRYARHPERDHIRVVAVRDSDGRPMGAAILFREIRPDRDVLYVEDVIVLPGRPTVIKTLLCAALRLAGQYGVDYLVTSPGRRSIRHAFWELGFEDRARNAAAVHIRPPVSMAEAHSDPLLPDPLDDRIDFWHGMMF